MDYARTDFPATRRFGAIGRYGNTTHVMLAVAALVMFATLGTLTTLSSESTGGASQFGGFTMQNTSRVTFDK